MHDFKPVAIIQRDLGPSITRHDVPVQLDRNTIRLHAEFLNQSEKSERGRDIDKIALFSIDMQFHREVRGTLAPQQDCIVRGFYSALRRTNFLVAVRPSKFACTSSDESGNDVSSTSILISAAPPASATAWV